METPHQIALERSIWIAATLAGSLAAASGILAIIAGCAGLFIAAAMSVLFALCLGAAAMMFAGTVWRPIFKSAVFILPAKG